jgi:pyruvate/2-oxoglutarate dehydrogenase complex dihydrolipoamide dehydrogenase (E3) component
MDTNNLVAEQPAEVAISRSASTPSAPAGGRSQIFCDLAVVGRGTVALEAARAAIRRQARVVLIHQSDPEDAARIDPWLLSHALDQAKQGPARGNDRSALTADTGPGLAAVGLLQQARQFFTPAAEDLAGEDIARAGAEVLQGSATFTGPSTLKAGAVDVRFRRAIVAPTTVATPPEFVLPEGESVLTAATLVKLAHLPQRLAVFGADSQACQWAQLFRRLGCEVHLIDRDHVLLPGEDPQIAAIVEAQLRRSRIRLHLGCRDIAIETMRQRSAIVIAGEESKEKLLVDEMFWCGPRRLDTAGMGLPAAGVVSTDQSIATSDALRTTNPRIYVVGEGCGPRYGAPLAAQATARVAVHNALTPLGRFFPQRFDWHLIPRTVYSDPEIIQIGLTHHEITAARSEFDKYRQVLAAPDRAGEDGPCSEFIEVVVDRPSGRVAAVTVVAARAESWIAPLELLLARRLTLAALADAVPCYPSRLELLKRIADRCLADREARYGLGLLGESRALRARWARWCKRAAAGSW